MTKQKMTDDELIAIMMRDRIVRRAVTRKNVEWFFPLYFHEYLSVELAPFHHEMMHLLEDDAMRLLIILAFRGSGKSTLMNLVAVLWHILGRRQCKFVLVVSRTLQQAKQHVQNIKYELEKNSLLKDDLGPFEEQDEWNMYSLTLPHYGAKIMAVSTGQSIRGMRYLQHRPDLIVCDDLEDHESVRTREGRDKTYEWVMGELLPAGKLGTRVIFLGNLLHEDALLKRIRRQIDEMGIQDAAYREYPLLDDMGRCLWPEMYPDEDAIRKLRESVGDEMTWQHEYLLRMVSDSTQVIHPDWIRYYDALPVRQRSSWYLAGIDLAISERECADYTAMVSARIDGNGQHMKIFILPNLVNERLTFPQTIQTAMALSSSLAPGRGTELAVEDVGYQRAMIQELQRRGCAAYGFSPRGQDKRARLALISHLVQNGTVLFPSKGAEKLIEQLVGFGRESHDDLADAFSILIHKVLMRRGTGTSVRFLGRKESAGTHWRRAHERTARDFLDFSNN
ncbi:MAG: hypothetical protein WCG83_02330 [Candidatus Peregrinibacteria bacterium]